MVTFTSGSNKNPLVCCCRDKRDVCLCLCSKRLLGHSFRFLCIFLKELLLVVALGFHVFLLGVDVFLCVKVLAHWIVVVDDLFLVIVFVV